MERDTPCKWEAKESGEAILIQNKKDFTLNNSTRIKKDNDKGVNS